MADLNPLIDAISKLVGATREAVPAAEEATARAQARPVAAPGRSVTSAPVVRVPSVPPTVGRTSIDVEQALGGSLTTDPVAQSKVVHDYLHGAAALNEAAKSGATHIEGVSVPVWSALQDRIQRQVDADPEVQDALRKLYVMQNTQPDLSVRSTVIPDPARATDVQPVSNIIPDDTPKFKRGAINSGPTAETRAARDQAWKDLTAGIESQNIDTVSQGLEQIHALEPAFTKSMGTSETTVTPDWKNAITYMQALEQKASEMQQAGVTHDQWAPMIDQFREASGLDMSTLPPRIRRTVGRVEAWADAMKPASMGEMIGQIAGVPRALMSSFDASAPGRQGLLMISRPEYMKALPDMIRQMRDPVFFEQHQQALRERETFPLMQDAGLAITGMEGEKLTPREEAFRSNLAEKIPFGVGAGVKGSERGYVGFLNDLRANVFDTELQLYKQAGIFKGDGGTEDAKLMKDLAEWINNSTGRGSTGNWDPGLLNTVLFSPRLAISRAQTFNPQYYWKLSPPVRMAALKANMSAAAIVIGLVQLAQLGGAKVTWDFRNPDAGKIRIGNTRIDLGGGHFQMLRFLAQMITGQKINSMNEKVTTLGKGQAYDQSRLDLLVNFLVSKEAPVASLVTDMLKGKGGDGKPPVWWKEVGTRVIPLAIQDTYDAWNDLGTKGLLLAPLAFAGAGLQSYSSTSKTKIPFLGVEGIVPPEQSAAFEQQMLKAESDGTAEAIARPGFSTKSTFEQHEIVTKLVDAHRMKAREEWIKFNAQAYAKAVKEKKTGSGAKEFPLTAPPGAQ